MEEAFHFETSRCAGDVVEWPCLSIAMMLTLSRIDKRFVYAHGSPFVLYFSHVARAEPEHVGDVRLRAVDFFLQCLRRVPSDFPSVTLGF